MNLGICPLCNQKLKKGLPKRSNLQNRYLWGVPYHIISEHTGFTTEEVHEILKHLFLKTRVSIKTKSGQMDVESARSSASLSTVEFNKYVEDIRTWAAIELGLDIPEPIK